MITIWGERIAAVASIFVAIFFIYTAWNFPANGNIFPFFCGGATIAVALLMILRTFVSPDVFFGDWPRPKLGEDARALLITGVAVLYVLAMFRIGYYVSSAVLLVGLAIFAQVRSPWAIGLSVVVTLPLIYLFFETFLGAPMPRGLLF